MAAPLLAGGWPQRLRFYFLITLILASALAGGASRADAWTALVLRPAAVVIIVVILLLPGRLAWRNYSVPLLLLGALTALMIVQLIPLPPAAWLSLPGREFYAEAATAARMVQPWRPLSLSPDLTLNSLAALVVPAAVLIGAMALRSDQRAALVPVVLAVAGSSALLGLVQVATSDQFYFYAITNLGRPVGLLANVNHQAVLLAAALPLMSAWSARRKLDWRLRTPLALAAGAVFLATIAATGSRAGVLLALVDAGAALLIALPPNHRDGGHAGRRGVILTIIAAPVALIALSWFMGRASGIDRLFAVGQGNDPRFMSLPVTLQVLRAHYAIGAGFGTFDPIFRGFEPDSALRLSYFNHAHNDLLELAITGGTPALMIAAAFLAWLGTRTIVVIRDAGQSRSSLVARAASVVLWTLLAASLADYPLRTPLMEVVMVLAVVWLGGYRPETAARADRRDGGAIARAGGSG